MQHAHLAEQLALLLFPIPYAALLAAGRWAHSWAELADALKVDVDLVMTRYRTMHPAERALLHRDLDDGLERVA